jgi:hypothetical protein
MIFHEANSRHLISLVGNLRTKYVTEKLTNIGFKSSSDFYHPSLSLPIDFFSEDLYFKAPLSPRIIIPTNSQLDILRKILCKGVNDSIINTLHLPYSINAQIEQDPLKINHFADQLKMTLELFETYAPNNFQRINLLIKEIIPLGTNDQLIRKSKYGRGLSSIYYWGGVFLDTPHNDDSEESIIQLLMNMAHEAGHQALYALQSVDTIVFDASQSVYSPIRKVDRPILKTIHAMAAISGMMLLCEELLQNNLWSQRSKEIVHRHYSELRTNMLVGLARLPETNITELGKYTCRYWYKMALLP